MQSNNTINEDISTLNDEELHTLTAQYISESNQLLFQHLPKLISQIITQEAWKTRNNAFKNFGEYALNQAPEGLGIRNNDMLWLLKSAMNKKTEHAPHWGDVLGEVDSSVRMYAKEKKIQLKELSGHLTDYDDSNPHLIPENIITYLPSRSNSNDGLLLKLKKQDPEAYENVIQNKVKLKEAWSPAPRKKLQPIESVKNKFSSLSKTDREAFLAWLEQEKENME
jgi:hypothetical protein